MPTKEVIKQPMGRMIEVVKALAAGKKPLFSGPEVSAIDWYAKKGVERIVNIESIIRKKIAPYHQQITAFRGFMNVSGIDAGREELQTIPEPVYTGEYLLLTKPEAQAIQRYMRRRNRPQAEMVFQQSRGGLICELSKLLDEIQIARLEEIWRPLSALEQHMQSLADSFLWLFGNMPRIQIRVLDATIKGEPKPRALAYCVYSNDPLQRYIVLKTEFLRTANMGKIINTMKHELVHAWMGWNGLDWNDSIRHGPLFQLKAKDVGVEV